MGIKIKIRAWLLFELEGISGNVTQPLIKQDGVDKVLVSGSLSCL